MPSFFTLKIQSPPLKLLSVMSCSDWSEADQLYPQPPGRRRWMRVVERVGPELCRCSGGLMLWREGGVYGARGLITSLVTAQGHSTLMALVDLCSRHGCAASKIASWDSARLGQGRMSRSRDPSHAHHTGAPALQYRRLWRQPGSHKGTSVSGRFVEGGLSSWFASRSRSSALR